MQLRAAARASGRRRDLAVQEDGGRQLRTVGEFADTLAGSGRRPHRTHAWWGWAWTHRARFYALDSVKSRIWVGWGVPGGLSRRPGGGRRQRRTDPPAADR